MVTEKNYEIYFQDVCGIAFEEKRPTKEELKLALIQDCKNKIEMLGLDKWLEHTFSKIKICK